MDEIEPGSPSRVLWRPADRTSQILLDVAAGRPIQLDRLLRQDELELAHQHGLMGLMAHHDNVHVRTQAIPAYARLAARQQVMDRHLSRILESLHASGLRATVLKGAHLANWAYRDPAHRTTTDIDLLVPLEEMPRAIDVLREDAAVASIPPKTPKADKRNVPMTDPSGVRFTIDLHWDLFSYTQLHNRANGATAWAWERAELRRDHPLGPLWELSEEARIAFLATHALLDHRFRLILFRDLAEVSLRNPDWSRLHAFAHRWGLRSFCHLAFLMAEQLVDARLEPGVLSGLRVRSLAAGLAEHRLERTDVVTFDGHRVDLLNLAIVLMADERLARLRLMLEAPAAVPGWWRRTDPLGAARPPAGTPVKSGSVAVLVSSDQLRGAEVFGKRLADGLGVRGWSTEIVPLVGGRDGPSLGVVPLTGRGNGRLDIRLVRLLRAYLKRRRPGVLVANGGSTLRYAAMARLGLRDKPYLLYSSIGEPSFWIRGRGHRLVQRALHRRADRLLAVSEATASQLEALLGPFNQPVDVARTGVPQPFFELPLRAPHKPLHLLYVGSLSEEKNPLMAVAVLDEVARTIDATLRFVGSGPLLGHLRDLVHNAGLADRVEFLGSVVDVTPHLEWCDLLLQTSLTEGLPGVLLEAAAAGTPAVATDVGGTREAIHHGVTGLLVPSGDTPAMIAAVLELAMDHGRLRAMGIAARDLAAREFTLRAAIDRYDEILREVMRTAPAGSTKRQTP